MKELDLRISRSYGPGRYDPQYEEQGHDYPYGWVRWSEGRNMSAFLESVARGAVTPGKLVTHTFPLDQAERAYDIVAGKIAEPHVGIVLQYPEDADRSTRVSVDASEVRPTAGTLSVGFAGAGSFAKSYLLPHLKGRDGVRLHSVATSKGYTATAAAKKFGFAEAHSDADALVRDERIDTVFIATRHDLHAPLVIGALESGKHVFVEKPLAVRPDELSDVTRAARNSGRVLQVGFNRRFSPLAVALRESLARAGSPVQVTYRVNAGSLPGSHWLLDPAAGGGRIVGEGCHFIDLIQYLTDETPSRLHAASLGNDADGATTVTLEMSGGSVGVLIYQANAPKRVPKERIEAFAGGRGGIIDDWRSVELLDGRGRSMRKVRGQAKGFAEEIGAFLEAVKRGRAAIPLESLVATTAATFAALESLSSRSAVDVTLPTG